MKREDLFLAIGQVEESRLARSELAVQTPSGKMEEPDMKKKSINVKRIFRNTLVAALIISMLAITAYAVASFVIFESPEEMITAIFGDHTGFDHGARGEILDKNGDVLAMQPAFKRVPVDETVMEEEIVPHVTAVGKSISWEGYALTIDAHLYDAVTQCGLLTYTLENPEGLDYELHYDGDVWFPGGEIVDFNQYGYSYIIQDKSTDTKLAATYYYQLRNPESTDLVIGFTQWATITPEEYGQMVEDTKRQIRQEISGEEAYAFYEEYQGEHWVWFEANRTREELIDGAYEVLAYDRLEDVTTCPDRITIPEAAQGEMTSITLGNSAVTLSPIAITVSVEEIENFPNSFLDVVKIRFTDGSEYVVKGDYVQNYVFAVADSETEETTFMFNRIIDVNEVTSVIVDGDLELSVD